MHNNGWENKDILEHAVTTFVAEIKENLEHNEDLEPAVIKFIKILRTELEILHGL